MLAKAERGTKRQCRNCATKFYDLNRSPVFCPACGVQFVLETEVETKKPNIETVVSDEVEVEVDKAAVAENVEVISLDDAEDEESDVIENLPDVDLEDDDEAVSTQDDHTFLETDEDDDEIGFDVKVEKDDD